MHYADGAFDRAAERRQDGDWLTARLADPASVAYLIWRGRCLLRDEGTPVALPPARAGEWADLDEAVLLGVGAGVAHFALDISAMAEEQLRIAVDGTPHELREVAENLPHDQAALLAYARGLMVWHDGHRFCGACGGATTFERAGHARRCGREGCGRLHFPRTDPAVITLVIDDDRCLLARRAIWPTGRRSTIAGFVEPGETLEDAVRREVAEEVGVGVGPVRYRASQPWPFPSSLMMGFWAKALDTEITVDGEEISEAAWYSRQGIDLAVAAGELTLPPIDSISRRLVEDWRQLPQGGAGIDW
ncbi:MAG: NAD(+) diphosphatase [Alphaproteobacteria bacterium]|jgi:NAD+ diphosphatase|nr:NAD(+) diphosphatase [Alphaproteobacteria bacterium]